MSIYRGPMSISSHPCPSAGWAHLGGLAHLHRWPISRSRVGPSPFAGPIYISSVHLQGEPMFITRMGPNAHCGPSAGVGHVQL